MIATTFAGRPAAAAGSTAPVLLARRAASVLLNAARIPFRGTPVPRMNDHMLQDIGLSRADYEALRG